MRKITHIVIAESSDLIFEGLSTLFYNSKYEYSISRSSILDDIECLLESKKIDLVLINPRLVYNNEKILRRIRRNFPNLLIACVNLTALDNCTIALFDFCLNVYDSSSHILIEVRKQLNQKQIADDTIDDSASLTERETEVLLKIIKGNTNKEIAEMLCISVHTVISHRKNIMTKTGIRSQAGLALYAVSKSLISLDDYDI